jgi:Glycosyltransferase family 28 C-terminal domain
MIGYYIHHQGFGHLARAVSIVAQMSTPVTALTSLDIPEPHPFAAVVKLPRDDDSAQPCEPTARGALHWAPLRDHGYTARMSVIAQWVSDSRPEAAVVDVSVEVATFLRLMGVPVIVMALPGKRIDAPHLLVHRLADHIVAAWPEQLCIPPWLHQYASKTSYVGGISRFDGREIVCAATIAPSTSSPLRVLVLSGRGGAFSDAAITKAARACPSSTWTVMGGATSSWTRDPWPEICAAHVVVTHAGQSCIADVAAAGRPAVVIPQPRPFDEQNATAGVLRRYRLAVVTRDWPDARSWPALLAHASTRDPTRWRRWQVHGAAARAASAIEAVAHDRPCGGAA